MICKLSNAISLMTKCHRNQSLHSSDLDSTKSSVYHLQHAVGQATHLFSHDLRLLYRRAHLCCFVYLG